MWEYGLLLGDPGEITCSEEDAQHNAAPFLVIAHLPAPQNGTTSFVTTINRDKRGSGDEQVSYSVYFIRQRHQLILRLFASFV